MAETQHSYLIVRVAGRLLALPVDHVAEVLRFPALEAGTAGHAGAALLGFATLRGALVPVLGLGALLGFENNLLDVTAARVVSARVDGLPVALVVDEVIGVRSVDAASLQAISLPGGAEQVWGTFDAGFAQMIEAGGLVPGELWTALQATTQAGVAA